MMMNHGCRHQIRWRAPRAAVYLYRCTEMNDIDAAISKAHGSAEAAENEARQIEARDRLDDINHSGPAPEFKAWVEEVQMPMLARQPHYQQQFQDRITELNHQLINLEHSINQGRLDLEPAAGICRREVRQLAALLLVPTHG